MSFESGFHTDPEKVFIEVILPLSLGKLYTYAIPVDWHEEVEIGKRVIVQFGKSKLYTALVYSILKEIPEHVKAKSIEAIIDDKPVIAPHQFKLWEWASSYYMCSMGAIMAAAVPLNLRLSSETSLSLISREDADPGILNDMEYLVYEALHTQDKLNLKELAEITNRKQVYPIIKSLLEKQFVTVHEEIKARFKPRTEKWVKLHPQYQDEEALKILFDKLEKKAPKRLQALMRYYQMRDEKNEQWIQKKALERQAQVSPTIVSALVKADILEMKAVEVDRLPNQGSGSSAAIDFNEEQGQAYKDINEQFKSKSVVLLHGVTSSGKTELYIRLIKDSLQKGKKVLYLLPEIALTGQIIGRLRKYFGDEVAVYHSRYNLAERTEVWDKLLKDERYKIILGARSAVFLPHKSLGLIIVDEEHDGSYKQHNPAPRYHGREMAIMLGHMHKAPVLLGSATPSLETYYHATHGKYGLVELHKRYGDVALPEIIQVNIKEAHRKKRMHGIFSPVLKEAMEDAINRGKQIILFQNIRGFSSYVFCVMCDHVPECKRCDVRLSYHKRSNQLRCHYCGYSRPFESSCEACGTPNLKLIGSGTQKIEEEIKTQFPNVKSLRMDYDTTRTRKSYDNIISEFSAGGIQILVGTQMVTKGLDFGNVIVVGVMDADHMLHYPDFRSYERTFQLLSQVAGRAGRRKEKGKAIIQSYNPENSVINWVKEHDYLSFYNQEIQQRERFGYPPYKRLVKIIVRHKNMQNVSRCGDALAKTLKHAFGKHLLGPEFPLVPRVRNYFIMHMYIKLTPNSATLKDAKQFLLTIIEQKMTEKIFKGCRIHVDVDPVG